MVGKLLFFTNCQKVLSFLIQNPDKEYFDRQIAMLTSVSRAGTNLALRELAQAGIISRQKRGRMCFYRAVSRDPFIRCLKIVQNVATLLPIVKKLHKASQRVVLYGSAASGENTAQSDIDIFILAANPEEVKKAIFKDRLRGKIQYVVHTSTDYVKSKKNNPTFYRELERGIVLWQEE